MNLLVVAQTALQSIPQIDYTAIVSSAITAFISIGVTGWVYKVQNNIIAQIRLDFNNYKTESDKKTTSLETKVIALEKSENNWFKKYHELKVLIIKKGCKPNCMIKNALDELMSKEGETI